MARLAFLNNPFIRVETPRHETKPRADALRMQQAQTSTTLIPGISEVVASYKCFLLDQFGVIHDGQRVYPGAVKALQKLSEAGKQTIILSNSSRRASSTVRGLQRRSIDPGLISGVVTSGELAFAALPAYVAKHPNARVLHFNWGSSSRNAVSIAEHGFNHVVSPSSSSSPNADDIDPDFIVQQTDVIVAHGTNAISLPDGSVMDLDLDTAKDLLRKIAAAKPHTPFFVANPDIITVDGPVLRPMPGALAKVFDESGGRTIHRLGKPDPVAYEEALKLANVNPSDVLAVGDSLAHDILGAADAGVDSLYIAGGINAERFNIDPEEGFVADQIKPFESFSEKTLAAIIDEEAPRLNPRRPTFVSSFFQW